MTTRSFDTADITTTAEDCAQHAFAAHDAASESACACAHEWWTTG